MVPPRPHRAYSAVVKPWLRRLDCAALPFWVAGEARLNAFMNECSQAVIFDLTQTLVNSADGFRAAEKAAQEQIADDLNPSSPDEFMAIYRQVKTRFQDASQASRADIWKDVYHRYGREPDARRLSRWEDEYWDRVEALTSLFPETERVLDVLGERYPLGLVTNIQHSNRHLLDAFPDLKRRFGACVLAGARGMPAKPAPEPFRQCLQDLGVDPAATVYVGDDWRIDIQGAQAAGLRVVWLQHALLRRTFPQAETDVPIITSLEPLLNIESLLDN